jgi:hypothetical protein
MPPLPRRPERRLRLVEAIDHPSGRAAVLELKQRPASSLGDLYARNLDRAATHTLNGRGGEASRRLRCLVLAIQNHGNFQARSELQKV